MFSYSGYTGRKRHTMSGHRMRHLMDNVGWTVHGKAVPFLHGRAIDGFFIMLCQDVSGHSWCRDRKTYGKSHPRDGFILRDVRLLEHGQRQFLIVELDSIDAPRRRPSADHQMMLHVLGVQDWIPDYHKGRRQVLGCAREWCNILRGREQLRPSPLPTLVAAGNAGSDAD